MTQVSSNDEIINHYFFSFMCEFVYPNFIELDTVIELICRIFPLDLNDAASNKTTSKTSFKSKQYKYLSLRVIMRYRDSWKWYGSRDSMEIHDRSKHIRMFSLELYLMTTKMKISVDQTHFIIVSEFFLRLCLEWNFTEIMNRLKTSLSTLRNSTDHLRLRFFQIFWQCRKFYHLIDGVQIMTEEALWKKCSKALLVGMKTCVRSCHVLSAFRIIFCSLWINWALTISSHKCAAK